jgi:hypothetical protein
MLKFTGNIGTQETTLTMTTVFDNGYKLIAYYYTSEPPLPFEQSIRVNIFEPNSEAITNENKLNVYDVKRLLSDISSYVWDDDFTTIICTPESLFSLGYQISKLKPYFTCIYEMGKAVLEKTAFCGDNTIGRDIELYPGCTLPIIGYRRDKAYLGINTLTKNIAITDITSIMLTDIMKNLLNNGWKIVGLYIGNN